MQRMPHKHILPIEDTFGIEMNSVVIIGVPYAEPTPKAKAQIAYFEECYLGLVVNTGISALR